MAPRCVAKAVACGLLLGLVPAAGAAQNHPAKRAKPDPALAAGAKLFKENCAVCHGDDGKGNGPPPAASSFKEPTPDLTTLAKRHDGKFPAGYVKSVLRTGITLPDHGPAEMPVWGVVFRAMTESDDAKVTARIADLTNYIESLQSR